MGRVSQPVLPMPTAITPSTRRSTGNNTTGINASGSPATNTSSATVTTVPVCCAVAQKVGRASALTATLGIPATVAVMYKIQGVGRRSPLLTHAAAPLDWRRPRNDLVLKTSRTINLPAARHAAKPAVQGATSSIAVGRTRRQRRRSPVAPASNRMPIRPPPPAGSRSCQDRTQCRIEPSCPAPQRVLSWIWAARQKLSIVATMLCCWSAGRGRGCRRRRRRLADPHGVTLPVCQRDTAE